jgi:cell division transport system permease protein
LVLFFIGSIRAFIINSKKLADDFKKNCHDGVLQNEANDSILKAFGEN